jgi:hypothetical protein
VQLLGVESKAIVNLTTFVHQAPFHKLQATLEWQGTNTTLQNTNWNTRCANHKLTKFKWTNHKAENQIMQILLGKPPTTTQIKKKEKKN